MGAAIIGADDDVDVFPNRPQIALEVCDLLVNQPVEEMVNQIGAAEQVHISRLESQDALGHKDDAKYIVGHDRFVGRLSQALGKIPGPNQLFVRHLDAPHEVAIVRVEPLVDLPGSGDVLQRVVLHGETLCALLWRLGDLDAVLPPLEIPVGVNGRVEVYRHQVLRVVDADPGLEFNIGDAQRHLVAGQRDRIHMQPVGDGRLQLWRLHPGVEHARHSLQAKVALEVAVGAQVDAGDAGAAQVDGHAIGFFMAHGSQNTFA